MIKPLFRWAGGKNKHLKYISPHIVKTSTYVEPFFGAGAVFCYIANNNLASHFIINDIKKELIDLYFFIKNDLDNLITHCQKYESIWIPKNKEQRKKLYYKLREEYWNTQSSSLLFFLLKTCFNGIWQTCKDSNNLFGTPCGLLNEKANFINYDNIRLWNNVLQNTEIYCGDFSKINIQDGLIYCDPPYRGSFTTYGEKFDDIDQIRLLKWCQQMSSSNIVLLSNKSDGEFFENNNCNATIHYFDTTHTAGRRLQIKDKNKINYQAKKVTEIIMKWNN